MKPFARTRIRAAMVFATLALAAGCAGLRLPAGPIQDVSVAMRQRKEKAVLEFEQKRDNAEFQAALGRWRHGDVAGCRESLTNVLKRTPNHRDAGLLLAELHLADQQPEAACRQAESVLAAHPDDAEAHHILGLALEAAGQTDQAKAHFEKAVQLDPKNETYALSCRTASQPVEQAAAFESDRSAAKADRIATSSGDFGPAGALLEKGDRALSAGDKPAALAYFRQAMAAQATNPQISLRAAALALGHNEPELAATFLEGAVKIFPDSAALYRMLGTAHYRRGDMKASQAALSQSLSLDKSNALAYFLMSCTLRKLGQSEAADSYERQAETLDPRYRR
jgi:Tfp pilus assembly protein PilF